MNICTKLEFTRKYSNMTLHSLTVKSLLWCSNQLINTASFGASTGGIIICDQTSDRLNFLFHLFENYFEPSMLNHSHFFINGWELCLLFLHYVSYQIKIVLSKTKTKGHLRNVCRTDHLFAKQRARDLMIWLRLAINQTFPLQPIDIVQPTA